MTAERRLTKLEGALSPKAATLLWLTEAHQFGSLPAYVDWLIDQPISAAPLVRVPEQAETAVRQAMRGEPCEAVRQAARQAIRDAFFLVDLVITLNRATQEMLGSEGLRYAALFWEMRALTAEAHRERADPSSRGTGASGLTAEHWSAWRRASTSLVLGLYVAEEARHTLERRYLDGHLALFPEAVEDWARLRDAAEGLAGLADGLRSLFDGPNGRDRRVRHQPTVNLEAMRTSARSEARGLTARLVDEARAAALDALGEGEEASAIAERSLRLTGRDAPRSSSPAGMPGSRPT